MSCLTPANVYMWGVLDWDTINFTNFTTRSEIVFQTTNVRTKKSKIRSGFVANTFMWIAARLMSG